MNDVNYCQAVFPSPELDGAVPCAVCRGLGITHERVSTDWDRDPVTGEVRLLLLPVFCPACGGCGRSGHDGCELIAHGYPSGALDELIDGPPPGADSAEDELLPGRGPDPECPACDGRGWRPIQSSRADDPDGARIFARMPCRCAKHLIEPVPAEDVE
ncbi:hypothetical protein [Actinomadura rupiterrae]|uniref:hypothetical protein n=1 Tax=Actinomadura rupiterrae TaxID=559627 RepID=UPI0020A3889F|nr:hypothetical protein [Actinomadura rupiterrae]MCP2340477.1 hypothetical protein [Actinomadura rupiterrae]